MRFDWLHQILVIQYNSTMLRRPDPYFLRLRGGGCQTSKLLRAMAQPIEIALRDEDIQAIITSLSTHQTTLEAVANRVQVTQTSHRQESETHIPDLNGRIFGRGSRMDLFRNDVTK